MPWSPPSQQRNLAVQDRVLEANRPPAPINAITVSQLRQYAAKTGASVAGGDIRQFHERLRDFSQLDRARILQGLNAGYPVVAYRPSKNNEPAGGVPVMVFPVKLDVWGGP